MEFEAVIGLEIHVEMKTRSKMFSSSPVEFGAEPNTLTSVYDLAFPGVLPVVNKEAVRNAIRVSHALHMKIDQELHFDRKNYFYSDLPKGYQITQNERPIGSEGYLDFDINGEIHRVEIERLHMEEDTCKQLHFASCTLVDYNRAGVPLIEIVTKPCIHNAEVAAKYVETIREIVVYTDVSDGKMEEGSLRCDVNVSIREKGSTTLGNKVEIKNINSINYVKNAIEFEIKRQIELYQKGETIIQETRRYDEKNEATLPMRVKTDAVDYKYFPEPNITPIVLSDEFVEDAINTCPELASSIRNRFINEFGLTSYDTEVLLANRDLVKYFNKCIDHTKHYKVTANWIIVDIQAYLNKEAITIYNFPISPKRLADLVNMIESKEISNKQGREIFTYMLTHDVTASEGKKELGISSQISDEDTIRSLVNEVLDANAQSIIDFKAGKDRALGFMIGQVMRKSGGKVNPSLTNKIMLEEIGRR